MINDNKFLIKSAEVTKIFGDSRCEVKIEMGEGNYIYSNALIQVRRTKICLFDQVQVKINLYDFTSVSVVKIIKDNKIK